MKKIIVTVLLILSVVSFSQAENKAFPNNSSQTENIKVIGVLQNAHNNPNNPPGINIVAKVIGNYPITQVQLWWDNLDDIIPPGIFPGYFTQISTSDYYKIAINTVLIGNFNSSDRIMWRIEAIDNQNNHYYYPTYQNPFISDTTRVWSYSSLNNNIMTINGPNGYVCADVIDANNIIIKNNKAVYLKYSSNNPSFPIIGNDILATYLNVLSAKSFPLTFVFPPSITVTNLNTLQSGDQLKIVFSKTDNNMFVFDAVDVITAILKVKPFIGTKATIIYTRSCYDVFVEILAPLILDPNFQQLPFNEKISIAIYTIACEFLKNPTYWPQRLYDRLVENGILEYISITYLNDLINRRLIKELFIKLSAGLIKDAPTLIGVGIMGIDFGYPPYEDTVTVLKTHGDFIEITPVTMPGIQNPIYSGTTTNFALAVKNISNEKLYNVWIGLDIYAYDYVQNRHIKIENTKTDIIDPETGHIGLIDFSTNQGRDIKPGETKLYISNNYNFTASVTNYYYHSSNIPYKYVYTAWSNGQPGQLYPDTAQNLIKDYLNKNFIIRDNSSPSAPILSNVINSSKYEDYEMDSVAHVSWSINTNDSLDISKFILYSNGIILDTIDYFNTTKHSISKENYIQNIYIKAVDVGGLLSNSSNTIQISAIPQYLTVYTLNPKLDSQITTQSPLLDWVDAQSPLSYRVQISSDSIFNNIVLDSNNISNSQMTIPSGKLIPNSRYFWRVKVNYSGGNTSNWSLRNRFRTSNWIVSAPQLLTPGNGTTGISITPWMNWTKTLNNLVLFKEINLNDNDNIFQNEPDAGGTPGYWLQISSNSGFTSPIVNIVGITDTFYYIPSGNLSGNALYYWRVKATNINGDTSTWSSVFTFTTISGSQPPPKPRLIAPSNSSLGISLTPTLDWNDTTSVVSYRVQLSYNLSFTNLIKDSLGITSSFYNIPSGLLNNNTMYYWKVISTNSAGNSPWSDTWNFTTIASGVLPPPQLLSPVNGATGQSVTPYLDWSDVSGASYYRLMIDISLQFNNPVYDVSSLIYSNHNVPSGKLNPNVTYYWKVAAQLPSGQGTWSDVFNFKTGTYQAPLGRPELYSPVNGSTGHLLNTYMDWSDVTNATSYSLQIALDSNYNPCLFNQNGINSSQYTLPSGILNYFSTYFWRVNATNSLGIGPWSYSSYFTTKSMELPYIPNLLSPSNNSTGQPLSPVLIWSTSNGASSYRLQIANNSDFINPLIDLQDYTNTNYTINAGILNNNITYYWRVYASNSGGNSNWSSTFNFTTLIATSPPTAPSLISPANNAVSQSIALTMDWGDVTGASAYRIQVALDSNFISNIVDAASLTTSQFDISNSLLYGTKYYWRVNASNNAGTSPWTSPVWNFTTENQPFISNPTDTIVSGIGQIYDVKALDQFVYCLAETGLFRINIEEPANPYIQNKLNLPSGMNNYSKLLLSDGYAYISNGTSGLIIVNISNPNYLIHTSNLQSIGNITELAKKDSAIYALTYNSNILKVISVKNPLNPNVTTSINTTINDIKEMWGITVVGNYLFCAGRAAQIFRWNILDPYNPSGGAMLDHDWDGDFMQILYDDNYLFTINNSSVMHTYNVNPTTGQISRLTPQTPWYANISTNRIARKGVLFYIITNSDISSSIWYLENIYNPIRLDYIIPNNLNYWNAKCVDLNNTYSFIGAYGQLIILPLASSGLYSRLDMRGGFSDVKRKGNYLYTAGGPKGLTVYSLSDKAHPMEVSNITFGASSTLNRVYTDSTNYVYCLIGGGKIYERVVIVNVADPNNPVQVSSFSVPWKANGYYKCEIKNIVVKNNIAYAFYNYSEGYVAPNENDYGVAVFNLSNITSPSLLGKYSTNSWNVSAILSGDNIYTLERRYYAIGSPGYYAGWNGIVKYSLSNPNIPTVAQSQDLSGDIPVDFTKYDTTFYVITGQIYNIPEASANTVRYINESNLNIYQNRLLTTLPEYILADKDRIYLSDYSAQFNIYNRDTSLTFIENKTLRYGAYHFAMDSPYVHICQNYALGTYLLNYPQSAPITPMLISPVDNAANQSITPALDWNDVLGANSYYVQVSDNMNFTTTLVNQTNIMQSGYYVPPGILNYNTIYYWRIKAANSGGTSPWSEIWNFQTQERPPDPPILISPENNSTISTLTPTLIWNDSLMFGESKQEESILLSKDLIDTNYTYRIQIASNTVMEKGDIVVDTSGVNIKQITVPSGKLTSGTQYYWRVNATNSGGTSEWSEVWNFTTAQSMVLNLKVYLEGFWNGSNHISDTIKVYLANSTTPYALADSQAVALSGSGTSNVLFSRASSGSYYIVIKHRNHLETWSALPQTITAGTPLSYDFTTAQSQAYGNNLIYSNGAWCIFGGDINGDGFVDGADMAPLDNDLYNYVSGYVITDLNGDQFVDGADMAILDNNLYNYIGVVRPSGKNENQRSIILKPERKQNKTIWDIKEKQDYYQKKK